MADKSFGESPKSMLAMRRLAARPDGIPIAIPNRVSASVSRKIIQNTFLLSAERDADADFACAPGDAVGHESVKANRGQQKREAGEKAA